MQLIECPGCSRHVRSDERACPFCDRAVAPCTCRSTATGERALSRAAVLFVGATAVAACGDHEYRQAAPPYAATPVDPLLMPTQPRDAGPPDPER